MRTWIQAVVVALVAITALPALAGGRKTNGIEVFYRVPGFREPSRVSGLQSIVLEYGAERGDCRVITVSDSAYPCRMNAWGEPELAYADLARLALELIGYRIESYPAIQDMLDEFVSGRVRGSASLVDRVSLDPHFTDKLELRLMGRWGLAN